MKKIVVIAPGLLYQATALAQFRPIEFDTASNEIEFSGLPTSWSSHATINPTLNQVLITFSDVDEAYYYLADSNFKIIGQFSIPRKDMPPDFYGSNYSPNNRSFFCKELCEEKKRQKNICRKRGLC